MTVSRFFSIASKVCNNREEIEEKAKRGRVKLQASLLAALTEKQERGRENTGETAWKAQICLFIEKDPNEKMSISEDILNAVIPLVWASEIPGLAKNATLERQSEFNTPILPVKKPHSSEYRLDAAFCIPVDEQSQTIFAFEWENVTPGRKTQLCCTVLPQGFENGPTSFGKVPAKELELWQNDHDAVTLLQYVDDLLIGSDSYEACLEATTSLLNFLGLAGYPVSKKKAQMGGKKKVQYMGFEIAKGQRELSTERKEAICRIAVPTSEKQLRGFLVMAGWRRLRIPDFGLIAKAPYAAVKGPEGILEWTPECRKSFDEIKRKLTEAPALRLPILRKPFQLYVRERQRAALGVLTQRLGSRKRPVGYFSKQLDEVSKGWPACLKAVAATATLVEESEKLTLAKYQAALLEQDEVVISPTSALNPTTLLPISKSGESHRDCLTTIKPAYSSRLDLRDKPLSNAEPELFTDGSAISLPSNTSAQKAELVALTRALELRESESIFTQILSMHSEQRTHVGQLGKKEDY
ncbi:hypothetical protein QYF61_016027 [Mycteria americana]|uniref:ribonuclease H n=1 Tax=Mycteria americana TaxID=33587 RepID=A0AAN7NIQ1_MYCAM|nr:hypothetical protein QYF61_016027 [Mycteria americana]